MEKEEFHDHVLFDMKKDPQQMENVFGKEEYRNIQEELTEKMCQHFRKMGTPKECLPKDFRAYLEKDV